MGTFHGTYDRVLRPPSTGRVLEQTVGVEYEGTFDDRLTRSLTRIGGVNYSLRFADGAELRAWGRSTREVIDRPFDIGSTLVVPAGTHEFEDVGVRFESNPSRALSGMVEVGGGEFWNGSQRATSGSVRYRLSAHLATSASFSRSTIRLPEGSFTGDLLALRLDWSFTPRMFLNAFVQYNGEADAWLMNIRYNLIHRPLSDIYLVWNEARAPGVTGRALLLKYTHLLAF